MTSDRRSIDDLPLAAYAKAANDRFEDPGEAVDRDPDLEDATEHATSLPATSSTEHVRVERHGWADDLQAPPPPAPPTSRATALAGLVQRFNVRDPRVLAVGVGAVVVVLAAVVMLGGIGSNAGTATPSATPGSSAGGGAGGPVAEAKLVLTGGLSQTFNFSGLTGEGSATATRLGATWTDASLNTLTLTGPVSQGTRATSASLELSWVISIDGTPVTFTSKAGECSVGMSIRQSSVSGSFACTKITSVDGTYTVGATGTYRT
jgi:hypothetical protein